MNKKNKGYEINERDIDGVLAYLKATDPENATPEHAIFMIEHFAAAYHGIGHDEPEFLDKMLQDIREGKRKKVLVVGASSYLGARLYFDFELTFNTLGTYNSNKLTDSFIKLDITDKDQVDEVVAEHKPDVIVHTANYPSARPAQNDERGYVKVNLDSTRFLVEAANKHKAKFVFISSFAALNPDNIYGKLKLESEEEARKAKAGYLILRPSLIVGFSPNTKNDRPFNRILRCIDDGAKAEFDTSWKFQPTYIGHLSQIIMQAVQKGIWNQTLPVVIDKLVTQYQIAKDILDTFNVEAHEIDKGYSIPPAKVDLSSLDRFELYPKDYSGMIDIILKEIEKRENFRLT